MSSSYRLELNKWLSGLNVRADRVLDIGGSQVSLKPRVQSWNVGELLIADLPNPHEDSSKPDIELDLNENIFIGGHNDDYDPDLGEYKESFDLIFCLEVFDYIWSPKDAFENISFLLKDSGTAWVSFPSFYPLHQPVDDDALRYMPGGIHKLAGATGLTVKQMIARRPETQLFESFYRAERMRAAKHVDHNFTGFIVELTK